MFADPPLDPPALPTKAELVAQVQALLAQVPSACELTEAPSRLVYDSTISSRRVQCRPHQTYDPGACSGARAISDQQVSSLAIEGCDDTVIP